MEQPESDAYKEYNYIEPIIDEEQIESDNKEKSKEENNNEYIWSYPIRFNDERIETQNLPEQEYEEQKRKENQNSEIREWQEVEINRESGKAINEDSLDQKTKEILRQVNEYLESQRNNNTM